jgi:small-conductance mechanosensitive channel
VGIGFGLQNVVNNFISGLILVFERPIKIGDTIEVGQLVGEVRRIGIRSSAVRTGDGAEVIVPNANLIAGEVINWTLSDRARRVKIAVGVAYGTEPRRVIELLIRAAEQHKDVLGHPRPNALFVRFGESSLDFELRFWTSNFDFWQVVQSDVALAVHAAITSAGIEIPFPQRDLRVRSIERAAESTLGSAAEPASPLESSTEGH